MYSFFENDAKVSSPDALFLWADVRLLRILGLRYLYFSGLVRMETNPNNSYPPDFMFTLTKEEYNSLIISPRSQSVTSEFKQQNRQTKYMPL